MTIYHNVYPYDASIAAAVLFTILFFVSSIVHLYQLLRTRTWYLLPFLIGGICKLNLKVRQLQSMIADPRPSRRNRLCFPHRLHKAKPRLHTPTLCYPTHPPSHRTRSSVSNDVHVSRSHHPGRPSRSRRPHTPHLAHQTLRHRRCPQFSRSSLGWRHSRSAKSIILQHWPLDYHRRSCHPSLVLRLVPDHQCDIPRQVEQDAQTGIAKVCLEETFERTIHRQRAYPCSIDL